MLADLPAPAEHIRQLLEARAKLSPIIDDGATVQRLDAKVPNAEAYLFVAPAGAAVTIANFGDAPVNAILPIPTSLTPRQFKDEITGARCDVSSAGLPVTCPPHALRMLSDAVYDETQARKPQRR